MVIIVNVFVNSSLVKSDFLFKTQSLGGKALAENLFSCLISMYCYCFLCVAYEDRARLLEGDHR